MRYFVVPHTHWDREWYRPFEHFRLMLGDVVDEVLDTLERDPDFSTFTLDGQAIVLEDYVAVRPENEARLRALIAAGRIEVGPSYVLPDEFLVCGEALVRNLLLGRTVCERFGGRASPAGYLPDSFGHPLQLPQILAGFGIETFLFSRGLGDQLDDLGVVFDWVAPDGSAVRAVQLLADYGNFARVAGPDDAEGRVRGILERFGTHLERAGTDVVVLCNGTDHARVQPEMPALCAELERRLPGSSFHIAQYGNYVAALEADELPRWSGELLGSRLQNVLRGVNSARLYIKQANEHAEQRLLAVETLVALSALRTGRRLPEADLSFAWQELLRNQPHDSICGCSCDEVHRDMLVRYESLDRTLDLLVANAVAECGDEGLGVFNALPFARTVLIRAPGAGPQTVRLDGFAAQTIDLVPATPAAARDGDRIESDRFRVEAAPDGTLTIEDLERGRRFTALHALEDEADMGDLYNFCPIPDTPTRRSTTAAARVLTEGPTCWELEVAYRADVPAGLDAPETVPLVATTLVRLVRGSDRIEFETTIENPARDHRVRVVFPVGDAPGPVRAEGQFAVLERPKVPAQPRADWREPPDATQHTCGVVALGPLALMTRGLPEYEARSTPGGADLCLTLLRCVGVISQPSNAIATRPHTAGPQTPTPEGQCLGRHVCEYALRLGADELDEVALLRTSQDYRSPPLFIASEVEFAAPLRIEGDVVFSCLKSAETGDALIARVFNPRTETAIARIDGPVTVERVRLDESGPIPAPDGVVEVAPGAIASLRLTPRPA